MIYPLPGFPIGTRIQLTTALHVCKSDLVLPKGSKGWVVEGRYKGCWGDVHPYKIVLDDIGGAYHTDHVELSE